MNFTKINLITFFVFIAYHQTFASVNPAPYHDVVDRHLSGFSAIDAGGSFDVYITQGAAESVKVDAPADITGRIVTEIKGGVLRLSDKRGNWHWGSVFGKKVAVYVTVKNLNAISATGSGDVFFKNGISASILRLDLSGSGDMSGKLTVKTLQSTLSGSGDLHITGSAGSEVIEMSGSGDYHARDVQSVTAAIRISGSGDAYLNVSNKLDASSSGSGDIRYSRCGKKGIQFQKRQWRYRKGLKGIYFDLPVQLLIYYW